MKKSLMALAVASACSAALAQNVTVYGLIDTGFQEHDNGSSSYTRSADNTMTTSRLGFRGSEDLGGGFKANFQLEAQINPATGSMGSTTVAANEVFNREAWVGISGSFGEIRTGRQDVTYAQDIDIGTSQFMNFGLRAINGTAIELGTDQKNVVKYISPTVGGISLQFGFGSANNAGATTDTQGDQKGAAVRFDKGAMRLFAGAHKTAATATAGDRDFVAYGAAYDFGAASVGITHATGDVNNANDVKNKNTQGSVRIPLAAGAALHGVYAVAKDGAQSTDGSGKGYTVGMTKALSKRTTLYAAYTAVDNEANARMYMAGQVAAPATAGLDTKTTSLGISHTF